ncbi:MAG TPA: glucose-6-phosphate dehydrogenase, partial [Acidimicrobiia bacterium]|nr:glucose-6-phosphate dehydrogenase [Acidimicrobiia bacterium]
MTPPAAPRRAPPATMTVFGASGDLAARKLYPALAGLARDGMLPDRFALVGTARSKMSDDDFR